MNITVTPVSHPHLAMRYGIGGSFLQRLIFLRCSNTDAFSGSRTSYERLRRRVPPADMIERGDAPGQVLMLLELDTVRRHQLCTIAASHGWPAPQPQPWDQYVATYHSSDGD